MWCSEGKMLQLTGKLLREAMDLPSTENLILMEPQ